MSYGVSVRKRNWSWWAGKTAYCWRKSRLFFRKRNIATTREAQDRVVSWTFRDAIDLSVSGHSPTEGWSFGMASVIIGTGSNDDDDGSKKKITKKESLCPFKLYRVYFELLDSLNVADFSWSWIFKSFIQCSNREGKICRSMSTSPIKRRTGRFTS